VPKVTKFGEPNVSDYRIVGEKPMFQSMNILLLGAFLAAGILSAQTEHKLTARELFYTPVAMTTTPAAPPAKKVPVKSEAPPKVAPKVTRKSSPPVSQGRTILTSVASYPPLGVRCSLLKRSDSGRYDEIDAGTVFRSGDKLKVVVKANDAGYLYVISRGPSGTWMVQFPSPDIDGGNNRIGRDLDYTVPPGGRFNFTDEAGEEKLFIVLSRVPAQDLENLIYSLGSGGGKAPAPASVEPQSKPEKALMMASNRPPIGDPMVNRLRSELISRDLVFEKVDDETPGDRKEKAVYVASPDRTENARVVVDLTLKHQ
jgi:hypothetical protein